MSLLRSWQHFSKKLLSSRRATSFHHVLIYHVAKHEALTTHPLRISCFFMLLLGVNPQKCGPLGKEFTVRVEFSQLRRALSLYHSLSVIQVPHNALQKRLKECAGPHGDLCVLRRQSYSTDRTPYTDVRPSSLEYVKSFQINDGRKGDIETRT